MDTLLMLRGETRHCDDCDTTTLFLPVEEPEIGPEIESVPSAPSATPRC